MSRVIVDMSMSLDGFISPRDETDGRLHNWYFSPSDQDARLITELIASTGAIIMGRRSYDLGDQFDGYVDNPYAVEHFVVTQTPPTTPPKGTTRFTYVTDGIESAVSRAKLAAGEKNVVLGGGASLVQSALRGGLVDEVHLHLVPLLLGDGLRLFDHLGTDAPGLECYRVIPSTGVTHLYYRILR